MKKDKVDAKSRVTKDESLENNPKNKEVYRKLQDLFTKQNIGYHTYKNEKTELRVLMK